MIRKYGILFLFALWSAFVRAEIVRRVTPPPAPSTLVPVRQQPLRGIFVGVLGTPIPSVFGINIAFQRSHNVRFMTGLGFGAGFTIGGGVEYTFMPKSTITPIGHVGLALLFTDAADLGRYYDNAFDRPVKSNNHLAIIGSLGAGAELHTRYGFRAGVGLNMGFFSSFVIVPYARVGYFFF